MIQKVLVAMSGGVDSSVAALLLREMGYDVVGAHMKLWDYVDVGGDIHKDGRCCTLDSINDCRMICNAISAPFYVLNLSQQFKEKVIEDFVAEYRAGRTPNPCVRCNIDVKWSEFLRKANEVGCDYIATGHYAIVEQEEDGRCQIRKGTDKSRDQSYVLWGISQEALSKTIMPLGAMLKSEVRSLAKRYGLRTAEKTESREICFVADDDYHRFLTEYEAKEGRTYQPGDIVHQDGRVLGQHKGTPFYTIGQRKGLGIAHPTPLYVQKIDVANNRIIVGDDEALFEQECEVENVNWVSISPPELPEQAEVKIRYLHPAASATVTPLTDRTVHVIFDEKQRAITPGQSAVFYRGDLLLGGGVIA
ncbi:MAG: tRNA 2-thiouridine(34) synthase MnmA [Candidatus Zixiibacteriota bacterium]|nr:MAG: tRNA 2-thiouridine(34) synthase MnmA [candidate division Zixibacteria bacterium]